MSLELWSAVAQIGTFVVIAVTAIAALIQLQHLRAANQVASWQMYFQMYEGSELRDALHFVRAELADRLNDPGFRQELRSGKTDRARHPEIKICNFYDQWGGYYRMGVIDREAWMIANAAVIVSFWEMLEPAMALLANGGPNTSFESFEFMAVKAKQWLESNPQGAYPAALPRMPLVDRWRDVDRKGQD